MDWILRYIKITFFLPFVHSTFVVTCFVFISFQRSVQKEMDEKNEMSRTFEQRLNEAHIEVRDLWFTVTSLVRSSLQYGHPSSVPNYLAPGAKNKTFNPGNTHWPAWKGRP